MALPRVPTATYRVQFRSGFGFAEAGALAPYWATLGISDLYASPVFAARAGSTHGYDVIDPAHLNPELGGREGFEAMVGGLQSHGLRLLLDIVPNHMAAHPSNPWWWDVLKHGRESAHAQVFDIVWDEDGRVVLPILRAPLDELVREGRVRLDSRDGEPVFDIDGNVLPLNPRTLPWAGQAGQDPPLSGGALRAALDKQAYKPEFWKEGSRRINYRRFFDVSDLVGVRVEDPSVVEATHCLILELVAASAAAGLRIDHIDGLLEPREYLSYLKAAAASRSKDLHVVVEKILGEDETLPEDWPCHGTTGYEFGAALTRVFVDPAGFDAIERHARSECGWPGSFHEAARESKREVLRSLFVAEVESAARNLAALASRLGHTLPIEAARTAVVEVTACLPVYRTYIRGHPVASRDRAYIEHAIAAVPRSGSKDAGEATEVLRRVLLLEVPSELEADARGFVLRWQQLTGPAAAKGVEDTALYRYVPLASLNEVGCEPVLSGDAVEAFHRLNRDRSRRWPLSLSATSTHDTKRSEDVRARINVLSELASEWIALLEGWRRSNAKLRRALETGPAPSAGDELLLYQTLVGAWPLDGRADDAFISRIAQYMEKAVREAKSRTSWIDPDKAYEDAVREFVAAILDPARGEPFISQLRTLAARTSFCGMLNSLSQTVLKLAAPGIPDLYQGTELWDLSLVDPDNRRPVDYGVRVAALEQILSPAFPAQFARSLLSTWQDGRIKLFITAAGLRLRRRLPGPFVGEYIACEPEGHRARHVVAFARRRGQDWVLAAATRFTASLSTPGSVPVGASVWGGTRIPLPDASPSRWRDELTGNTIEITPGLRSIQADQLFSDLPIALLVAGGAEACERLTGNSSSEPNSPA